MKRLLVIVCFIFCSNPVLANAEYMFMCSPEPYPVSGAFPQAVSKYSGTNFLFTSIAEKQMKKALNKDCKANWKVDIKAFGGKNFLDGKFKSATASASSIFYNGAYISNYKMKTICPYNHVVEKDSNIYFPENLLFEYSGEMTSDDFSKSVLSQEYLKMLSNLSVTFGNRILFKIFSPEAKIENNKVVISYKIMTPAVKRNEISQISVEAALSVKDGQIVFVDSRVGSSNSRVNIDSVLPFINVLNPFTYEFKIKKDSKAIAKIMTVDIKDDRIYFTGMLIIPKNYVIKK